jgi:hypothetical protein
MIEVISYAALSIFFYIASENYLISGFFLGLFVSALIDVYLS